MASKPLAVLSFITVALVLAYVANVAHYKDMQSTLHIEPCDLALGEVWPTSQHVTTVRIRNLGPKDVRVRSVIASCNCTRVNPSRFTIAPLESKRLKVRINLSQSVPGNTGAPFAVELHAQTNDETAYVWKMIGRIRPHALQCAPVVDLGEYTTDEEGKAIDLVVRKRQKLETLKVQVPPEFLPPVVEQKGESYLVRLSLKREALRRIGNFSAKIALFPVGIDCPPLDVNAKWSVVPLVSIEPSVLAFGPIECGSVAEGSITVQSRQGQRCKILQAKAGDSSTKVEITSAGTNRALLSVRQLATGEGSQQCVVSAIVRLVDTNDPFSTVNVDVPIVYFGIRQEAQANHYSLRQRTKK